MKKLLILLTILVTSFSSFAQHDEAQKAIMEKYMKEHGAEGMAKLQELMNSMTNAEARSSYTFPLALNMLITNYKDNKNGEKINVKYYVNNDEGTFAFQAKDGDRPMMMVYDTENNTMVIFDEQKQSYMAMNIEAFTNSGMMAKMNAYSKNAGDYDDVHCDKSGKTKSVKGYSCKEMVCENDSRDSRAEVWLSDDLPVNISKAARNTPWATYFQNLDGMTGMMMLGSFYEDDKLQASLEVTEINEKANHSINTGKYNKMDMFGGKR